MMLNIVADEVGVGAAVLIRACAPVSGKLSCLDCTLILLSLSLIQYFNA